MPSPAHTQPRPNLAQLIPRKANAPPAHVEFNPCPVLPIRGHPMPSPAHIQISSYPDKLLGSPHNGMPSPRYTQLRTIPKHSSPCPVPPKTFPDNYQTRPCQSQPMIRSSPAQHMHSPVQPTTSQAHAYPVPMLSPSSGAACADAQLVHMPSPCP
jgi:hypothetical protein